MPARFNVTDAYARGVWYAAPWIWQAGKWAVYSPSGVCVSLHDSKKEAVEQTLKEARRWETQQMELGEVGS